MGGWRRELHGRTVTEDEPVRRVAIDEQSVAQAPTDRRLTPEVGQVWLQSACQQTSPFVEGPTSRSRVTPAYGRPKKPIHIRSTHSS